MRIFIGIDLDCEIRGRISLFLEAVRDLAPAARWVRPESLHITLKFIGEQPPERVEGIAEQLRQIDASAFDIRFAGYGFFPTAKAPRVFWIGIHAGPLLAGLAGTIDASVAELGIAREPRPYSPHLTLARGGTRSGSPPWRKGDGPNRTFAVLEKRCAARVELDFGTLGFGTMTVHDFILYQSQLSSGGSKYAKLQSFPLRPVSSVAEAIDKP